ncbi:MAG TPA: SurA N-terminal domain-containing protein [Candidatus Hydrogenedentes bacterium]|nr:SurA N-terminal domain-containing protein [Candidatus Hydrogenedentota bacterium]HPG68367.1 SurA N-terminal domain-containing protein [Candidatus Hydrogenedentota bacterium]
MIHLMRKYRKVILWALVILVVPTFVLWGGYRRSDKSDDDRRMLEGTVARVGSIPISAIEFQRGLNAEAERRSQYGERPTPEEMAQDGTANRVLDRLVDNALLRDVEAQRAFACSRDYLVQRLKDDPSFKTEDGQFDAGTWNAFVEGSKGRDWNEIYDSVNEQVKREVILGVVQASARPLENEIRAEFDLERTRMKVKYVTIEPAITPTEEELKAHYDADPSVYNVPEQRVAQYAAVSLLAPKPALADEVLQRARDGEDFAELAKQYSDGFQADAGGDMGWLQDGENIAEHQRVVLGMAVGAISDIVEGPRGYYLFKVDEERTAEGGGQREVKVRQIEFHPTLTDSETAERRQQADALLAKAKESGNLEEAAQDAGFSVRISGKFSSESTEIENVSRMDSYAFRKGFDGVEVDQFAPVIEGRDNLLVAKVIEYEAPTPQALEDVRDRVEQDVVRQIQASDEYADKIDKLCAEIAEKAHSLEEVVAQYPDLKLEIAESEEFNAKESPMAPGLMVRSRDIYHLAKGKEPGAFIGPVKSMRAPQLFLELVSFTPPTDEERQAAQDSEEDKEARDNRVLMTKNMRLMDYIQYLKNQAIIEYDNATFARVLGTSEESENPAEEPAPASDEPAEE